MAPVSEDVLEYLHVCGVCFDLDEEGRPDGLNQRCRCRPRDDERWPGFDFNERVTLCSCCSTEVLRSGSRWSPFFCRECQLMAMGASLWHRRLVLPIGRHTIMHSFVPDTRPATLAAHDGHVADLARAVHASLKAVSAGSDLLRLWSAKSVARNLVHLGHPGGAPLVEYLAAIEKGGTGRTRFDAFADMCAFVKASAE